jgi:membrane protease YdiL (CAAX protease family)
MDDDGLAMISDESDVIESVRPIAPWWHSVLVIGQLGLLALMGPTSARLRVDEPHLPLYVAALMATWLQLGAVVAGVYHRRRFFFDTLRRRARVWWRDAWVGAVLYLGTMVMFAVVMAAMHAVRWQPRFDRHVIEAMAPRSWSALLLWLAVSASVGFCEEHVFRGYLLQQAIALLRGWGGSTQSSMVVAVVLTSALFGSLHVYEGVGGAVLIGCLGVVYSVVALRMGNLRAVIVAHTMQDFVTFAVLMMHHAHASSR